MKANPAKAFIEEMATEQIDLPANEINQRKEEWRISTPRSRVYEEAEMALATNLFNELAIRRYLTQAIPMEVFRALPFPAGDDLDTRKIITALKLSDKRVKDNYGDDPGSIPLGGTMA